MDSQLLRRGVLSLVFECSPIRAFRSLVGADRRESTHPAEARPLCTLADTYPFCYVRWVDAVLHALADPHRRRVIEALREGEATAGELSSLLPIARPGVSRHLRVLREAGLVDVRRRAQWRVYVLCPEPLAEVDIWLERYRPLWEQRFAALHTEIARGRRGRRREESS